MRSADAVDGAPDATAGAGKTSAVPGAALRWRTATDVAGGAASAVTFSPALAGAADSFDAGGVASASGDDGGDGGGGGAAALARSGVSAGSGIVSNCAASCQASVPTSRLAASASGTR
jgi:hypothetical protein